MKGLRKLLIEEYLRLEKIAGKAEKRISRYARGNA